MGIEVKRIVNKNEDLKCIISAGLTSDEITANVTSLQVIYIYTTNFNHSYSNDMILLPKQNSPVLILSFTRLFFHPVYPQDV